MFARGMNVRAQGLVYHLTVDDVKRLINKDDESGHVVEERLINEGVEQITSGKASVPREQDNPYMLISVSLTGQEALKFQQGDVCFEDHFIEVVIEQVKNTHNFILENFTKENEESEPTVRRRRRRIPA